MALVHCYTTYSDRWRRKKSAWLNYVRDAPRFIPMAQDAEIAHKWPLHWMVWNNDVTGLTGALKEARNHEREKKDPRGRTPLHLAVTLGHTKCAQLLVEHDANCLAENRHQWNVVAEAISSGLPELLSVILSHHEQQLLQERNRTIPQLLDTLCTSPDFYVEMKWEFTSWVPFLSRMCPSDTYKIWKKGSNVRVDTTLLGFHNMRWQRGHQSFLFSTDMSSAHMYIIDYDRNIVYEDKLSLVERPPQSRLEQQMRLEADLASRLTSPVISTIFNAKQLAFQRQKAGIWGFRSDRNDEVNGWMAKVFSATGVEVITRTRTEHLPEGDKKKQKHVSPFEDFLGKAEQHGNKMGQGTAPLPAAPSNLPQTRLTAAEYFKAPVNSEEYDAIGRRVDVTERKQQLKATMWLAEGYPLSLSDQLLPIVELMALNNTHFDKLKDFLTLQVPAGFPVKIEIPLFHIMTAKVTFGNINGVDSAATHVTLHDAPEDHVTTMISMASSSSGADGLKKRHQSGSSSSQPQESPADPIVCINHKQQQRYNRMCQISDDCFKVPSDFRRIQNNMIGQNEEEELLQLAIQQSLLMQQGNVGEGLGEPPPVEPKPSSNQQQQNHMMHDQFDDDLALAIALSLGEQETGTDTSNSSQQQQQQQQQQQSAPLSSQLASLSEDEILEQIIKLSLTEK